MRANEQRSAPFQLPLTEFLDGEPRIYGPVLLCTALAIVLGRRLFANDLTARLAQFAVAYVAFVWLYRVTVTSAVVETWWAYNMVAISTALAAPVLLDWIERSMPGRAARFTVAAAIAGAAATAIVVRYFNEDAVALYEHIRDNVAAIVALLAVGIVAALVLKLLRSTAPRIAATFVLFALVAFVSLTPARYAGTSQTGEFGDDGRAELRAYQAAYDMSKLLEDVDQPDRRTVLWTTLSGSPVVSWTNLPHQGGSISNPEEPLQSLSTLGPESKGNVLHPATVRVLLLSEDAADMTRGVDALGRELNYRPRVLRRGAWGDGYLNYALVALPPR